MRTTRIASLAATWMAAAGMLAVTPAFAGQKPKEWNPTIVPANFVSQVDNRHFPLISWRTMSYSGTAKGGRACRGVLLTTEWSSLEPNSVEHKSYAPGIGLIFEEKGGFRLELVDVR